MHVDYRPQGPGPKKVEERGHKVAFEPLSAVVATGCGGQRLCLRFDSGALLRTKDLIYAVFIESRAISP